MVISMLEEMGSLLQQGQMDDDNKKIDHSEDEGMSLAIDIKSHQSTIADFTEQFTATEERLSTVAKSIVELDASVAMATKIRQDEHSEFVRVTVNNSD